jgi:integration host factor subunit alpha
MTFTKDHLINSIHTRLDLPKRKSAEVLESVLELIKKRLENGEDVLISGFGRFCVRDKKSRKGRNPSTGEDLMLRSRRVITFKCSRKLKDKMNGEG